MIRKWGGTSFLWSEEGICVSLHALLSVGWNCGGERISSGVGLEWSGMYHALDPAWSNGSLW